MNVVSREGGIGEYEDAGDIYRVRTQEGYFVMPPYDCYFDMREEMVRQLRAVGMEIERDTLRRQRDKLAVIIQDYLEWGAMTGSDRNLFETRFRAALAESKLFAREAG